MTCYLPYCSTSTLSNFTSVAHVLLSYKHSKWAIYYLQKSQLKFEEFVEDLIEAFKVNKISYH